MNQLHAVLNIYRSLPMTDTERDLFEQELAACLESDLKTYRIHVGVLKP